MRDMCKWYPVCPMKTFYERGDLPAHWIERYCWGDWRRCVRYQMEEAGTPHPDHMLPDGRMDQTMH
ncbi:MAG: uracil-DNA glycosylase [Kiritimatiellae bacterium]|nr:uracil-DNA glycosylase [Kiritimatiellia bacterium]